MGSRRVGDLIRLCNSLINVDGSHIALAAKVPWKSTSLLRVRECLYFAKCVACIITHQVYGRVYVVECAEGGFYVDVWHRELRERRATHENFVDMTTSF